jgi:hypothetical protein
MSQQILRPEDAVGKTIKKVFLLDGDTELTITFEDSDFFHIFIQSDYYDSHYLEMSKRVKLSKKQKEYLGLT